MHRFTRERMLFPNCLFWSLLLNGFGFHQAANSCAFFSFGKYPVVVKNSVTTLSFMINKTACNTEDSGIKNVKVNLKNHPLHLLLCYIVFRDGSCSEPTGCTCDPQSHKYSVMRPVDGKSQTLELSGKLQNGVHFQRLFSVHATYLPEILEMTTESNGVAIAKDGEVDKDSKIRIACIWSEGFPLRKAHTKKDGTELPTLEVSGNEHHGAHHSEYIIDQAGCRDSGEFSCEVAGAKENKTTLLLVKCAPHFDSKAHTFTFNSDEILLQFPVYVYKEEVVDCRLHKYGQSSVPTPYSKCGSIAVWSGQAPELTLTILLGNVTLLLVGDWRLELQNRMGTGAINFSVVADNTSGAKEETTIVANAGGFATTPFKFEFFILLSAIGCVFLLVIVLAAVVWVLYKRKGGREGRVLDLPPPAPHDVRRGLRDNIALQDVLRAIRQDRPRAFPGHHIYSEIDDDEDPNTTENDQTLAPPPQDQDGLGSSECLHTVANASSNSTVSEGCQHPAAPASESNCEPDDSIPPLASTSPEAALSDRHFHSVAGPSPHKDVSDKAVSDNTVSDKAVSDNAVSDKAVSNNTASDKAVSDNAVSDKAVSNNTASDKAVSDKAVSDKTVFENAVSNDAVSDNVVSCRAALNKAVSDDYLHPIASSSHDK